MNKLFQLSASRTQEAANLLKDSELIKVLESFGTVEVTGSYKHNLMFTPDIDLYVITPKSTSETAAQINAALIKQSFWNGYMLFDWHQFRKPYFPDGYYVGVQRPYKDQKWKVDIWVLNALTKEIIDFNKWMKSNLTEKHRDIILRLKETRDANDIKVSSANIYRGVIDHNLSNINEIVAKLGQN